MLIGVLLLSVRRCSLRSSTPARNRNLTRLESIHLDILPLRKAANHALGRRLILPQHNIIPLQHRVSLHENLPRLRLANHLRPQLSSIPLVNTRDILVQRFPALQVRRRFEHVQLLQELVDSRAAVRLDLAAVQRNSQIR
jgi:hypothetical protein